jgi:hypothetical protein
LQKNRGGFGKPCTLLTLKAWHGAVVRKSPGPPPHESRCLAHRSAESALSDGLGKLDVKEMVSPGPHSTGDSVRARGQRDRDRRREGGREGGGERARAGVCTKLCVMLMAAAITCFPKFANTPKVLNWQMGKLHHIPGWNSIGSEREQTSHMHQRHRGL